MFRAVAMTIFALAVLSAHAHERDDVNAVQTHAVTRAKQLLADTLQISADDIEVTRVEPKTWNDSSLGCGKPGTMAMQVITSGHAVSLTVEGREHLVHVAGNNAVICDRPPIVRRTLRRTSPARGLDRMMQQAREDLAQRLGVDPATIRIAGMQPTQWADSAMECPRADEQIEPGPIAGYRLSLKHATRAYTYHTDMKTVRACPAIEKE